MTAPKRVAILGGGVASLAAAWDLVHRDPEVEVTVYQLGWRLGGKCASGRNGRAGQRIEEHGLHVLFGFYENAFDVFRQAYAELDRPPGAPLRTWEEAFVGLDSFTLAEKLPSGWSPWQVSLSPTAGQPGARAAAGLEDPLTSMKDVASAFVGGVLEYFAETRLATHPVIRWIFSHFLLEPLEKALAHLALDTPQFLQQAIQMLEDSLPEVWKAVEAHIENQPGVRHAWIVAELGITMAKGMMVAYREGQTRAVLDRKNLIDWLDHHAAVAGGLSRITRESAPLRMFYEIAFAFEQGDTTRPLVAAGTAVIAAARILFDYRGHLFYQMRAGTGDVLAAPIYDVLTGPRYGHRVRFEFFREVTRLELNAAKDTVAQVHFRLQATPSSGAYDPLVEVQGLRCWPNAPRYELLEEGAALARGNELPAGAHAGFDLESPWTAWPGVKDGVIAYGTDYDELVLGIPIGALPAIAAELIAASAAWDAMITHVDTVATQSVQLWLDRSTTDLGAAPWQANNAIVHGTFIDPFSNWADWSNLIAPCEAWPAGHRPASLALICGVLPTPRTAPPRGSHPDYQASLNDAVEKAALDFIHHGLDVLWPKAYSDGSFHYEYLSDPANGAGVARFQAQYRRANVAPGERYVTSFPGSIEKRLAPGNSGFKHLYLAGDWTRNGLDVGAVEAAVSSGRLAARAVLGGEYRIFGADDAYE